MDETTDQIQSRPEPAEPKPDADQSAPSTDELKVPPASETWVEGQPTSDADYGAEDKTAE